jgi:hypothetical protein
MVRNSRSCLCRADFHIRAKLPLADDQVSAIIPPPSIILLIHYKTLHKKLSAIFKRVRYKTMRNCIKPAYFFPLNCGYALSYIGRRY